MAKLTGALLSMGAAGTIGKTLTFAKWKGVAYARQRVIPANPKTTKQTNNRAIWSMIGAAWLYAPSAIQGAFNAFASGKSLTGRNKFFSDNQKLLATDPAATDLTGFVMSPGNNGGLPATNLVITPGALSLTVEADVPPAPAGWTLVKAHAAALLNQNPTDAFSGTWFYASDDTAPFSVTLTGLQAATEYAVGFFLEWMRPDGSTAYSISLTGTGTTNA
jgi:hypothetical protein